MQVVIGIKFHHVDITYFNITDYMLISSRLYEKKFSFEKSSSMKQTIYQKLHDSNGNTFSFIPHVCYFKYHSWIAASEGRSLITQDLQHPCPILLEFCHSSRLLCKNQKKLEVNEKNSGMRDSDTDLQLCIFLGQMFKIVRISFINSELVRTLYLAGYFSNLQWKQ